MVGNTYALKHGSNTKREGMTPTYQSWHSMRQRVRDPNASNFVHYGGRGIVICERWDSFEAFLADMGERPQGMTLDRINNDGNYEPANCRWADMKTQLANRRSGPGRPR